MLYDQLSHMLIFCKHAYVLLKLFGVAWAGLGGFAGPDEGHAHDQHPGRRRHDAAHCSTGNAGAPCMMRDVVCAYMWVWHANLPRMRAPVQKAFVCAGAAGAEGCGAVYHPSRGGLGV